MKLPPLMDADDWGILGQGVILYVLVACALVALAAVAGLAWLVFQAVGGV